MYLVFCQVHRAIVTLEIFKDARIEEIHDCLVTHHNFRLTQGVRLKFHSQSEKTLATP